jgi:hypothetical protein
MDKFYSLIDMLNSLGYSSDENDRIFSMSFNYHKEIECFISYANLVEIKNIFPQYINLYISSSINHELDIFDFLEDEEEFNNEIKRLYNNAVKFKLIIYKENFIRGKIKKAENANLVFFIDNCNFYDYFSKDISFLESKVLKINKKNVFVLGNCETFLHNDFYMITNIKRDYFVEEIIEFTVNSTSNNTKCIIDKRNELCNWVDGSHFVTPEFLYVDFYNEKFTYNDDFGRLLCKRVIDLIIPFIGNFTGIVNDKFISIISGNKRVEIKYDLGDGDYNKDACKKLFDLYSWIYEKSIFDKITICRNVISVLISAKCQGSTYKTIIDNSDWLIKSVQDNFDEFLQKNIETYFKEKNAIIDKLGSNISEVNNQISELTKLTITNITSLLGTAVAAVIGYIAKGDYTFIRLLSFLYLCYLLINSMFNLPISFIRVIQARKDFNSNKQLYLKLYPDDTRISNMISRNEFNSNVYYVYTTITIGLIAGLTYFTLGTDINNLIDKFK